MAKRVIDVNINSQIKGGFSSLSKQLKGIEAALKNINGLSKSIDKLSQVLESRGLATASTKLQNTANSAKSLNREIDQGTRLTNQRIQAQERLNRVTKAFTSVSQPRGPSNRFYSNNPNQKYQIQAAVDSLLGRRGGYSSSFRNRNDQASFYQNAWGGPNIITSQGKNVFRDAVRSLTAPSGYRSGLNTRAQQAASYESLWGMGRMPSQSQFRSKTVGIQSFIDNNMGTGRRDFNGALLGDDSSFNKLKLHYQNLQDKATKTSSRIRRLPFGPRNDNSQFKSLIDQYSKLGHVFHNLQLATQTFVALSGAGAVIKLADEYTNLRNQIAMTSQSVEEIGLNMKDVFRISKTQFLDPTAVAKTYAQINGLRDALGLTRNQVVGVVGAISGAFAASNNEAGSKAAAQYQLGQAISSNKLGGDELRSVAENADFVKNILLKYGATVRGGQVGDAFQLYGRKDPLSARDITTIFNRQDVQAEVTKANAGRARTFGDAMQVAKVRAMELYAAFDGATGIFSKAANGLAKWLADDTAFTKFTNALEYAGIALTLFAARAAAGAVAGGAGAIGNRISAVAGYGQHVNAYRANSIVNGTINGVKSIPGRTVGAANAIGNGMNALGTILNQPTIAARAALDATGKSLKKFSGSIAETGKTLTKGATWGNLFKNALSFVKAGAATVIAELLGLGGVLSAIGLPVIALIAVIAALIYRFNTLLGKMNGGMNIIDVLVGSWNMLVDSMKKAYSAFKENPIFNAIAETFEKIFGFIDAGLKWLVGKAADNEYIRQAQANRMYGGQDSKFTIGKDGKVYQGTVTGTSKNGNNIYGLAMGPDGKPIEIKDGTKADIQWGDKAYKNGDLPIGFKANIPDTPKDEDKAAKSMAKKWSEFIRDMKLQAQQLSNYVGLSDFGKDIKTAVDDIRKRAMDVANFDTASFDTLDSAWKNFASANNTKAKQVNDWTDKIKKEKLLEAQKKLAATLNDTFLSSSLQAQRAGMSDYAGNRLDRRVGLIQEYATTIQDQGIVNEINRNLRSGNIAGAESLIRQHALVGNDGTNGNGTSIGADGIETGTVRKGLDYDAALKRSDKYAVSEQTNAAAKLTRELRDQLNDSAILNSYYGRNRDIAEQTLEIYAKYNELLKDSNFPQEEALRMRQEELNLMNEQVEASNRLNASYSDGIKAAIAEYKDTIANVSEAMKGTISTLFTSLEDNLVALITSTKDNIEDVKKGFQNMLLQVRNDILKMMLRKAVISPVMNLLGKIPGLGKFFGNENGVSDKVIQAKAVYLSGPIMGGTEGGLSQGLLSNAMGAFSGAMGGGASAGGSKGGGWLTTALKVGASLFGFPMFHGGGTVGGPSGTAYVNPSVFRNAVKYHTGTNSVGGRALASNEVPSILKLGETVLTGSQTNAISGALASRSTFAPSATVNYYAAPGADRASSERDAQAIQKLVDASIQQQMTEFYVKQQKQGSQSYNLGRRM